MKNLSNFRSSLLISAVALSVLSSPANAVSEEVVKKFYIENLQVYWSAIGKDLQPKTLNELMKIDDNRWKSFKTTFESLQREDMDVEYRDWIIMALFYATPQKWEQYINTSKRFLTRSMRWFVKRVVPDFALSDRRNWVQFITTIQSIGIDSMDILECTLIIDALCRVNPNHWTQFISTAHSIITKDMTNFSSALVFHSLGGVSSNKRAEFILIAQSLMTEDMDGASSAQVIQTLSSVNINLLDRVYCQIQRVMRETRGKIQFRRSDAAKELIQQLANCDSDERAAAFTNDLIRHVNGTPGNRGGPQNSDRMLSYSPE